MKTRLDGPLPHDIVAQHQTPDSAYKLVPSTFAHDVQRKYKDLYGVKAAGATKSCELPRRTLPGNMKETSIAGQKRKREEQLRAIDTTTGGREVEDLAQLTAESKAARQSAEQGKLLDSLKAYAAKKRTAMAEDALPAQQGPSAKKLKTHIDERERVSAKLRKWQAAELAAVAHRDGLEPDRTVIVCCEEADADGLADTFACRCLVWPSEKRHFARAVETIWKRRHVIWFYNAVEQEEQAALGVDSSMHACMRLLGGWLAGPSWRDACRAEGRLLQPLVGLQRSMSQPLEICMHKSVEAEDFAAQALAACMLAKGSSCSWRIRKKWKQVQTKSAYIILSRDCMKKKKMDAKRKQGKLFTGRDFISLVCPGLRIKT